VTDWTTRWWKTTAALKPKARLGYESLLRTHILPTFGDMPLARIQPIDVQEWSGRLIASGLSSACVRQSYGLLAAITKAAVASGYLVKSPCVGVKLPPATRHDMRFLDDQQVTSLAAAISEPYDVLVYVLAYRRLEVGRSSRAETLPLRCLAVAPRGSGVSSRGEWHLALRRP
jgi:hypothetical protein